jgi:hypothetical protein
MQLKYSQFLAALRQAQNFVDTNTAVLGTINASGARYRPPRVSASMT